MEIKMPIVFLSTFLSLSRAQADIISTNITAKRRRGFAPHPILFRLRGPKRLRRLADARHLRRTKARATSAPLRGTSAARAHNDPSALSGIISNV